MKENQTIQQKVKNIHIDSQKANKSHKLHGHNSFGLIQKQNYLKTVSQCAVKKKTYFPCTYFLGQHRGEWSNFQKQNVFNGKCLHPEHFGLEN